MLSFINRAIIVIVAGIIVGFIVGFYVKNTYLTEKYVDVERIRSVMDRSVAYERSGDLWLKAAIERALNDSKMTNDELWKLEILADDVEIRHCIHNFRNDTYRYMDNNIGLNLPEDKILNNIKKEPK